MIEGKVAGPPVELKKSQVAVKHTIMGMSVDQLATEYGLSKSNMRQAMLDMNVLKRRGDGEKEEVEKSKFELVAESHDLTLEEVQTIIVECGYKLPVRNSKKYVIIDDTAEVLGEKI